jgi:hypothetical protein
MSECNCSNKASGIMTDSATIQSGKVISIRDGVMEYLGSEINQKPADKVFKVYRPSIEVERAADKMDGLKVIDGHFFDAVDVLATLSETRVISRHGYNVLQHDLKSVKGRISGEVSLGYTADVEEVDDVEKYGFHFIQKNIIPDHLALVDRGRCGELCKITDKARDNKMEEKKTLTLSEIKESIALMSDIDVEEIKAVLLGDAGVNDHLEEIKTLKDKISELDKLPSIVKKAADFLDADYDYDSKTATQIMKDALSTTGKDFSDDEIGVAFKLLEKQETSTRFDIGDEDFGAKKQTVKERILNNI